VIYDFLNLFRPYLVRLLVQGEIPYRKIGARRRVFFQDLMEYLQQSRQQHAVALDELTDQAPKLDTGY
jgi:excisionase family DNA binding protein